MRGRKKQLNNGIVVSAFVEVDIAEALDAVAHAEGLVNGRGEPNRSAALRLVLVEALHERQLTHLTGAHAARREAMREARREVRAKLNEALAGLAEADGDVTAHATGAKPKRHLVHLPRGRR